ncbi:MAG: ferritin [Anaerolineaceae bacterium]|nr:ferritin [Anaerolineaceae bacterium]
MLISRKLNEAINAQVGHEFQAAMEYVQMAAYFEDEGLKQTAALFFKQAEEENEHAMKFIKYILDTGGKVAIPAISAPKVDYSSAEEVFKTALGWEMIVTKNIIDLRHIAEEEKDYAAQQFLDWFHEEQIEEVATMEYFLKVAQKIGDRNIFMLESAAAHHG